MPSVEPQGNNEPFIRKDLEKIYTTLIKKFIDIMLNNNGSAFAKEELNKLLTLA